LLHDRTIKNYGSSEDEWTDDLENQSGRKEVWEVRDTFSRYDYYGHYHGL
jgi:hypothetical protein